MRGETNATGSNQHEHHNDVTSFRTKAVNGLASLSNRMGQVDAVMIHVKKIFVETKLTSERMNPVIIVCRTTTATPCF